METISTKVHSRKRRHKSYSKHGSSRDKAKKNSLSSLLMKQLAHSQLTTNASITQNRLTMRMGLFNQGKASDLVSRVCAEWSNPRDKPQGRNPSEWQTGMATHKSRTREIFGKDNRISSPHSDSGSTPNDLPSDRLPASPGIEQLSVFLCKGIHPMPFSSSTGYLQRSKSRLCDLLRTSLQLAEKENESHSPATPVTGSHQIGKHNNILRITEDYHLAESVVGNKLASLGSVDRGHMRHGTPYISGTPRDSAEASSSSKGPSWTRNRSQSTSAACSQSKEFWPSGDDIQHPFSIHDPLLDITDPQSLLLLNDRICYADQKINTVHESGTTSNFDFSSSTGTESASASSSRWTHSLDQRYLKDTCHFQENISRACCSQTGVEPQDILEVIETCQGAAVDFMHVPATDLSSVNKPLMERSVLSGYQRLRSSQEATHDVVRWECRLPRLLARTVPQRSPSPQQKYYRRKIF